MTDKICVICTKETEHPKEIKFSDNFTAWSLLKTGSCLCDTCNTIIRDGRYRKSCWIMENGKTEFFKRDSIMKILQREKQIPFFIYITQSFKKQGYLNILSRPNYNNEKFLACLDHDIVYVEMKQLEEFIKIAKDAHEKKFSKTEMLEGPKVVHWKERELCESIMKIRHKQLWRLIVYAIN